MITKFTLSVLAGTVLVTATPAQAETTAAETPVAIVVEPMAPEAIVIALMAPETTDGLVGVGDDELGGLRGGDGMVIGDQTLIAVTTGNVIHGDYVAGNVTLSDFALSNFTGFGNMLINTGGQVSLQAGMNVTINVGD